MRRFVRESILLISLAVGCAKNDSSEEPMAVAHAELTAAEITRILSFEGTLGSTGDWVRTGGTVTSSTVHASAGTHSMVMSAASSITVVSTSLSALGTIGANLGVDIWLPTSLSGQSYKGNIQAFFTSSSLSLSNYATSNISLTPLTPGQFSRINVPLDSTLQSKLSQTSYTDLKVKFIFNLADATNQTFVDNLTFNSGAGGSGGAAGSSGAKSGGAGGSVSTGGKSTGGTSTGGVATGGKATGGSSTGGVSSGGKSTGGSNTGGATTGGVSTGGKSTGGSTGVSIGGTISTGGMPAAGGTTVSDGGTLSTGGATQTGGTTSTGGTLTGGTTSTGGTLTGGTTSTGGTLTGGTTSTGGNAATGGSTAPTGGAGPYTFTFQLPAGVNRDQLLFETTGGDLYIEDGVNAVSGSDYASVGAVAGGQVVRIGVGSQVESVWSDGDITLANNALVYGSLLTTGVLTKQAGSNVIGDITEGGTLTPLQTVSWTVNFPGSSSLPVNLETNETLAPGAYPDYDIKQGAHLNLSTGTYYFISLTIEPQGTLVIDNQSGPVKIYLQNGYNQKGVVNTTSTKGNVLFGVAGSNPVPLESSLNGILVAPSASVTLATVAAGHAGAVFAQSITVRQNVTVALKAFSPANFCGPSDPCSSFCACSDQSKPCTGDETCDTNFLCGSGNGANFGLPAGSNACWPSTCAKTGGLGSQCGRLPQPCQADVDCGSGLICGASNGAQFQYVSSRICWPAQCATDPLGTGCGTIQSHCGICPSSCTPNCASKTCGDPPDDGCGGTCTGYCNLGCTTNAQCDQSYDHSVCSPAAAAYYGLPAGTAACWYYACEVQSPSQRDCGTSTSKCGPQCPSTTGQCANRECGADPVFGTNCGTCGTGQYCDPAGKCQATSTDVVSVPVPLPPNQPTPAPSYLTPNFPKATDVGATQGTLAVTSQGNAHYSIPLFVPPGAGGLTPTLSMEYQSQLQDGYLGVGWSIGGLSTIARCPRVYGQAGLQDPDSHIVGEPAIHYDDNDQFCLDGNALVLVSAWTGIGAEYRTEQDSLVRVFARYNPSPIDHSGPDHFDVVSTDGRVSRYGGLSQAPGHENSLATGKLSVWSGFGVNAIWALSHVEDLRGNTIDYIYTLSAVYADPGPKQVLPWKAPLGGIPGETTPMTSVAGTRPVISQILYGGTASVPSNRQVNFEYEDLSGVSMISGAYLPWAQRFGWVSGMPYRIDRRISTIGTYFEDYEIRKYILQYDNKNPKGTSRSRLASVYECAQGRCLQPTKFTYKPGLEVGAALGIDLLSNVFPIQGNLGGLSLKSVQAVFDADGDGLPDLLLNPNLDPANPNNCNADFVVAHATGNELDPYHTVTLPHGLATCKCAVVGDLDNDGKSDIYVHAIADYFHASRLHYDSVSHAWTQTPLDSHFGCPSAPSDLNGDGFIDWGPYPGGDSDFEIDTDGDGVPNGIQSYPSIPVPADTNYGFELDDYSRDYKKSKDTDLGFSLKSPTESAASQDSFIRSQLVGKQQFRTQDYATGVKVLDVNGDGLKDVLTWSASAGGTSAGPSSFLRLWTNTGRNQFTGGQAVGPKMWVGDSGKLDAFLNAGTFNQAIVYDADGNGLEDLVFMTSDWRGYASALLAIPDPEYGTKFQLVTSNYINGKLPSWFLPSTSRVLTLDVNGDGASDLLMGEGPNQVVAFQKWVDHDLLDTVTDGNGRKASVTYVYGKPAGLSSDTYTDTLPQTNVSKPVHILPPTVQSITTTKADGIALTESYKYKEGRVGYYGRGLLGFTEVDKRVTGSDIGVVSDEYTYYHPDTLFSGRLGTSTNESKMYIEPGRPWKQVFVKHGVKSGLGTSAKIVDAVVTKNRTLMQVMSPAKVYMYVPWQETVTTSEVDSLGNEQIFTTVAKAYNYDSYGLPTVVTYNETGPTGTDLKSQITSTGYERGQSFLDKNLVALPNSVSTRVGNAGYVVTHNQDIDYYDNGLAHHVTTEPDDSTLSITTEYQYNSRGNATSVVQTAGSVRRETDSYYDASGDFVQAISDPLLHTTAYSHYRGYGQLALTKDENGLVSWRQVDSFGREITATGPNGNAVATSYEVPGPEANFLTSGGRAIAFAVRKTYSGLSSSVTFYDSLGHEVGAAVSDVDAGLAPLQTQTYYDSLGRKTYRSHVPFNANGPSEKLDHIVYDAMNRPTSVTIASDATPSKQVNYVMSYGHASEVAGSPIYADRAVVTTYPNQSTSTKILDTDGRTLRLIDRNGSAVSYAFDATGGVALFTDQANVIVHKGYDRYGRTTAIHDPIRGVTQIQYTPLGDTVYSTSPTGNITTHFDALNRRVDESSPEGTTTWTYDKEPGAASSAPGAVGRLVNVTGPATASAPGGHSVHYTYGPDTDTPGNRGKLRSAKSTIGAEAFAVDYDFDAFERLSKIHYPALSNGLRYSVTNQYSPAGRLNAVVEGDGGEGRTLWQITARDSMGRMKTEQSLSTMTTDYDYSDIDGLITATTTSEANALQQGVAYEYNFEHNVTSMASLAVEGSRSYQYDFGGRITDEYNGTGGSILHVDYLPNGNIASKSDVGQYTYGELRNPYAVTSVGFGAFTHEYDPLGRVTKRTSPNIRSGQQTFTWTSFDAVRTITDANNVQSSHEYNGLKERVLEVAPTQLKYHVGSVYQRTDDLQSGNRLHSMLVKAAGALVAEVRFSDDGAGTLGRPSVYSIRSGRLGSTTVVRDPSGNYVTRSYDSFGVASDETPLSSAVGFAGYYQDDSQSLLWLSNRPYDPQIGRTLTPDAIINGGAGQDGANRYTYAYNHPTTLVDPSGFFSVTGEGWTITVGTGGLPGTTSNPISTVNPGGKWGIVMNTVLNSSDNGPYYPIDEYESPVEARFGGQIIGFEPDQVPIDAQTGTVAASGSGAASANARGTAAGGDVGGDPGSILNACPDCLAQNPVEAPRPSPEEFKAIIDDLEKKGYKHWAFGVSYDFDAQVMRGGSLGVNAEVTDMGGGLYVYLPWKPYDPDATQGGTIGSSYQLNAAIGNGAAPEWTKEFYNYSGSFGPGTVTYFSSSPISMCQTSGWSGISVGYSHSWGVPIGAAMNQTYYVPIWQWKW